MFAHLIQLIAAVCCVAESELAVLIETPALDAEPLGSDRRDGPDDGQRVAHSASNRHARLQDAQDAQDARTFPTSGGLGSLLLALYEESREISF